MRTRSLIWRDAGISVHLPDRVARMLRRGRRAPSETGDVATAEIPPEEPTPLILADAPPLHIEARDPLATASTVGGLRIYPEEGLWYHTIEFPDGTITPGMYDHRPLVPHYGIPDDLSGLRVLDVATMDGFWAFEFERRGASVTAVDIDSMIDLDFPPPVREELRRQGVANPVGVGFEKAQHALGSKVRRLPMSIYDLDPDHVGTFDLVHSGDVLLHLERPLAALRAIRSVTTGTAMIVDTFDPDLGGDGFPLTRYIGGWPADVHWWLPSLDALAQMVVDAGFSRVRAHRIYRLPSWGPWRAILIADV